MENNISQERLEYMQQVLIDLSISNTNQGLIQGNKNYFKIEDKTYRCVMPSQSEQMEAEDYKDTYKFKIMGKFPTEDQLKKDLKEKQGIDIAALEDERLKVRNELLVAKLKGASIATEDEEGLAKHYSYLLDIEKRLMSVIMTIEDNLAGCQQKKVLASYYRYLAFKVTEHRNEKNEWVLVWKSLEDFEQDKSKLPYKAIAHVQSLLLNIRE